VARRGRRIHREADEFYFAVGKFDWTTGEEREETEKTDSENLEICVTPEPTCYTETLDTERKKESKDTHEMQDLAREKREKRAHLHESEKRRVSRVYIPTTVELAAELEKTKHLRRQ
jgi:hypothetical protein